MSDPNAQQRNVDHLLAKHQKYYRRVSAVLQGKEGWPVRFKHASALWDTAQEGAYLGFFPYAPGGMRCPMLPGARNRPSRSMQWSLILISISELLDMACA